MKLNKDIHSVALCNMLCEVMKHSFPEINFNKDDVSNITQLCSMSISPTGKEDPKEFIRPLSDLIINTIVLASKTSITNPILNRLTKMFFIEWCFRHEQLYEDWKWTWKNNTDGQLHYRSIKPLDEISF